MGSLRTPTNLSNKSCLCVSGRVVKGLRVERQVGLGFSWLLKGRRNRMVQSFCVTSLVSDGSSIAESQKNTCLH